jgi:hypothetical protein
MAGTKKAPSEKTTINLPVDLKLKAKIHALKAEGLRLVLAREGGK